LLASLAADLVGRQVAVIVAMSNLGSVRAALAATSKIPIIFEFAGDPIKRGLVARACLHSVFEAGFPLI
jgi:ABC-type uncharacterized transport system substrate-binding protein